MVLSKFCIFTVFRVISSTIPLALVEGIVTQSPGRIISLADNCIPATKPRILSLKTNIRMAADAPNPANNVAGDLSTMIATITMPPIKKTSTCNTWIKPFIGRSFNFSLALSISNNINRLLLRASNKVKIM